MGVAMAGGCDGGLCDLGGEGGGGAVGGLWGVRPVGGLVEGQNCGEGGDVGEPVGACGRYYMGL